MNDVLQYKDYSADVRIPSELHKEAAIVAAIKNISLNEFVRYAIDSTLTKEKNSRQKLMPQVVKQ